MKINDTIDFQSFTKTHRQFHSMQELVNALRITPAVWSWGAHDWTKMNKSCLRFKVQGHHHKGYVYLVVNGADLFDVYLTTSQGTIKHIMTDVYYDDLISVIDLKVEYIDEYVR